MHVTDTQVFKAAVKTGVISTFTLNINIVVGPEAVLHVPQILIIAGTTVDLQGQASFNILYVELNGILITYPTTYTVNYIDKKFEATAKPGSLLLASIQLKYGSDFQPAGPLRLEVGTFEMRRYVVLEAEYVDVSADTLIMERNAELNVVGKARVDDSIVPATAHGTDRNGGAHAAQGGVGSAYNPEDASQPYGGFYKQEDMATTDMRPGSSGGNGGKGGSYIKIKSDDFILDGILRASGEGSSVGGGGSGGSIYAEVQELKGLGLMECAGGSVSCSCGAGSGGFIGVDMQKDSYEGTYSAPGGTSPAPHGPGGPGSILTVSETNGEKLIVDNENGQKDYYMTLEEKASLIKLTDVDLFNYAKLQLKKDGVKRKLEVLKVNGDGTGLIRIQANQSGTLERKQSNTGERMDSKLNINLELHEDGEFFLSETVLALGLADTAFDLNGVLKGTKNFYVGTGRHIRIGEHAIILADAEATIGKDENSARVTFGTFQLEPRSTCEYDKNDGAQIDASIINLKYDAKLYADFMEVNVSRLQLELQSDLSASSSHRKYSETMDITAGSGKADVSSTEKGGAGHGGIGGGSKANSGEGYDSVYFPKQAGSRGTYNSDTDTKSGGKGGGRIHIRVGNQFINDGSLSTNGDVATSDGGGGSGGSILIETFDFEGYGKISSKGGDGYGSSGAGSGGLIAVICSNKILFDGDYVVSGGKGSSDTYSAGGGIVYLQDRRSRRDYKVLLLDNDNLPHEKYATINEPDMKIHELDEVHMVENAALEMADTGEEVTMNIKEMYGDNTGLFHLHRNQKLMLEYTTTRRHAFTTGVNLIGDFGSEILFPSILYTYGSGVFLSGQTEPRSVAIFGTLTGVSDLILGFETLLYFGPDSNTAFKDSDGNYLYQSEPKTEQFGTIDCRSFAQIKFAPDITARLESAKIDTRYKCKVSAETIFIQVGTLNIEAGAVLTGSAEERPEDTVDEGQGEGQDAEGTVTKGTGGGYATPGGGRTLLTYSVLYNETHKKKA